MVIGHIYKFTSPSSKVYIGQTTALKRRIKAHKNLATSDKVNQPKLQNSFKKYGFDNHTFEILETVMFDTKQEVTDWLNISEVYYIAKYDSFNNGLNLNIGGGGNRGVVYSQEYKDKMSITLKGRVFTEEHRKKLSKAGKGRVFTDEHKINIKEGAKNRVYTEESKARLRDAAILTHTGKKRSEETKAKISLANKNRQKNKKNGSDLIDKKEGMYV